MAEVYFCLLSPHFCSVWLLFRIKEDVPHGMSFFVLYGPGGLRRGTDCERPAYMLKYS